MEAGPVEACKGSANMKQSERCCSEVADESGTRTNLQRQSVHIKADKTSSPERLTRGNANAQEHSSIRRKRRWRLPFPEEASSAVSLMCSEFLWNGCLTQRCMHADRSHGHAERVAQRCASSHDWAMGMILTRGHKHASRCRAMSARACAAELHLVVPQRHVIQVRGFVVVQEKTSHFTVESDKVAFIYCALNALQCLVKIVPCHL